MTKGIQRFAVMVAVTALATAVVPMTSAGAAEQQWRRLDAAQPPGVIDVMDSFASGATSFTLGMQYGDDEPIERPFVDRCRNDRCTLTLLPLPTGSTIGGVGSSITGTSGNNVTVGGFFIDEVAHAQVAALWHFSGSQWTLHLNKIPDSVAVIHIAAAGPDEAWATGFSSDGTAVQVPTVYHRRAARGAPCPTVPADFRSLARSCSSAATARRRSSGASTAAGSGCR